MILYALTNGYLDKVAVDDIARYQSELFEFIHASHQDLFDTILATKKLPEADKMNGALDAFAEQFQPTAAK